MNNQFLNTVRQQTKRNTVQQSSRIEQTKKLSMFNMLNSKSGSINAISFCFGNEANDDNIMINHDPSKSFNKISELCNEVIDNETFLIQNTPKSKIKTKKNWIAISDIESMKIQLLSKEWYNQCLDVYINNQDYALSYFNANGLDATLIHSLYLMELWFILIIEPKPEYIEDETDWKIREHYKLNNINKMSNFSNINDSDSIKILMFENLFINYICDKNIVETFVKNKHILTAFTDNIFVNSIIYKLAEAHNYINL